MKFEYDVIIVGGGPSGSTTGYILSKNSIDVLIIDKFKFPREKLCGGLLSNKAVKIFQEIYNEDLKLLREKNIINFETNKYKIYCGKKFTGEYFSRNGFNFVERPAFDNYLLQKAKEEGAEILEGEKVLSVDLWKNEVKTSSGKFFKGKYIIGTDGVNSIIRRNFPEKYYNPKKWKFNLAIGYEAFIDREILKSDIKDIIVFFKLIDYGYAWIFPNKEKILAGAGGLIRKNKNNFPKCFDFLFEYLDLKKEDLKELKIKKHLLPFGNFLSYPFFNNTFLIGDAAGFVNPLSGDGIYLALKSANIVADFIIKNLKNEKKNLENLYKKRFFKDLYFELLYLKIIRNLFYSYIKYLPFIPFNFILNKY